MTSSEFPSISGNLVTGVIEIVFCPDTNNPGRRSNRNICTAKTERIFTINYLYVNPPGKNNTYLLFVLVMLESDVIRHK